MDVGAEMDEGARDGWRGKRWMEGQEMDGGAEMDEGAYDGCRGK